MTDFSELFVHFLSKFYVFRWSNKKMFLNLSYFFEKRYLDKKSYILDKKQLVMILFLFFQDSYLLVPRWDENAVNSCLSVWNMFKTIQSVGFISFCSDVETQVLWSNKHITGIPRWHDVETTFSSYLLITPLSAIWGKTP